MQETRHPLEMLFHWADAQPDQAYLFQPVNGQWHRHTWREVENQVRRMAAALKAMSFEPGSRIAIAGKNTAHWFMADLAIAMAGHVGVGLYPKQAPEHVKYIMAHSGARLVFAGPMPDAPQFKAALPAGVRTVGFPYPDTLPCDLKWDALAAQHEPLSREDYRHPAGSELWTLIYTSGTTGSPKGVMLTYGNIMFAVNAVLDVLPAVGHERLFSYLPLAHVYERGVIEMGSLYLGAEVHFLEDISKFAEQLAQVAPTRFVAVPLVWGRLQTGILNKLPQRKLDRLLRIPLVRRIVRRKILSGIGLQHAHFCNSGAAPIPKSLIEWFAKLGIEIMEGYGMSENTAYTSVNLPGAARIGSVGKPLPGCEIKFSEDGEILVRHPAVMPGYYKDPQRTAEVLTPDGWMRTGDKGHLDKDGYLYITGRVKDIFKTLKGKYVAPAPIEGELARNPDIDQLCFVGAGLKQPIMLVSLTPAARAKPRDQIEQQLVAGMDGVNATLEPHEEIAKIVVVKDAWTIDNGLMTPTLKVKRAEIEKRYGKLLEANAAARAKLVWES